MIGYRQKIAKAEGRCRACPSMDGADPHHVIPRSLGGRDEPDSVIPLCRRCHDGAHAKDFDILPLLTRAEELEAVRVVGIERALEILAPSTSPKRVDREALV